MANLDGVVVFARKNRKHRFFIASKENLFGGFKVSAIMLDSGCNSILLPLTPDNGIDQLAKLFPPNDSPYKWTISTSKGVSSKSQTLIIAHRVSPTIPIQLCVDLFPPGRQPPPCQVPFLRFHLCDADLKSLLEKVDLLNNTEEARILDFKTKNPVKVERRTHALLGQGLLTNFSYIQHGKIAVIVDPTKYALQDGWLSISRLEDYLDSKIALLPERFDDLEDEDHDGDDEDMYELSEEDYVD